MNIIEYVENYIEIIWNQADMKTLESLTTANFQYHFANHAPRNHKKMIMLVLELHRAFPDWCIEIDDIITEGAKVVVRWHGNVTHQGDYLGIAATGNKIFVCGINIYRIEDGRIAEEWEQTNSLSWINEMGALKNT